jgi:hypothetical protein
MVEIPQSPPQVRSSRDLIDQTRQPPRGTCFTLSELAIVSVLSGKPCNIVTATAILQGLDQQVLGEVVHEYKDLVTTARA